MSAIELTGIVICGGASSRMGQDKSLITYHDVPQRYYMAGLLTPFCKQVYLSLNENQEEEQPVAYSVLTDLPEYNNTGPVAALLTAHLLLPGHHFLVCGCDYPLLGPEELSAFVDSIETTDLPKAFYNEEAALYEPLLAFYPAGSLDLLLEQAEQGQYSLQRFLHSCNAAKYISHTTGSITSVDDPEQAAEIQALLAKEKAFRAGNNK